jgi:hypothetical protein
MLLLWIDTNQARSVTDLAELSRLGKAKGVRILIHPQVYLERRRQMRVEAGPAFSEARFDRFLVRQGFEVPPFVLDQTTAAAWADELYRRYATSEVWEEAKRQTLGGDLRAGFRVLPGRMPMTTDWLIALGVEGDPASRIVTHDTGEEWRALREMSPRRALAWDEALDWLRGLPDV